MKKPGTTTKPDHEPGSRNRTLAQMRYDFIGKLVSLLALIEKKIEIKVII